MINKINLKVHFPAWITSMFPSGIWNIPTGNKTVYLTFDDGPIPEVTPLVLDILKKHNIKATFFCVGENVMRYPDIYQQVLDAGHAVGNHTYNHMQGFKSSTEDYIQNVEKAAHYIKSDLFRPPHGTIKPTQYAEIINRYHLIMWDVISCDYDSNLSPNDCFKNVADFVRDGSIITFHDSLKAEKNVLEALPKAIEFLQKNGYKFKKIEFTSRNPYRLSRERIAELKENINKRLKGA